MSSPLKKQFFLLSLLGVGAGLGVWHFLRSSPLNKGTRLINQGNPAGAVEILTAALQNEGWDPLESTCRHASLSIL